MLKTDWLVIYLGTLKHNWAILDEGWNSCVNCRCGQELVKFKLIL